MRTWWLSAAMRNQDTYLGPIGLRWSKKGKIDP